MRINQNISAMNTYSRLTAANTAKSNSLAKLSSGLRINKAGDDAAGLAISEKMRGQIGGLNQAAKNAQDGISLIQTAEGGLNETHSILNRMRELAVQSSNDTNTTDDRAEIQKEMNELSKEVTRISKNTEFNTQRLLGKDDDGVNFRATFHIGANKGQNIELQIEDMSAESLEISGKTVTSTAADVGSTYLGIQAKALTTEAATITTTAPAGDAIISETTASYDEATNTITLSLAQDASNVITAKNEDVLAALQTRAAEAGIELSTTAGYDATKGTVVTAAPAANGTIAAATVTIDDTKGIDVSTREAADIAIKTISDAIDTVSSERSKLGATQNRLDHTINNLTTTSENLSAAESRIRDVDMAQEMMQFTKNNILSQAATSMLAQANQMPQSVLQLLQ